jgi:hypothetical protein
MTQELNEYSEGFKPLLSSAVGNERHGHIAGFLRVLQSCNLKDCNATPDALVDLQHQDPHKAA